ncbi:hypothetical protein RBH26_15630 [Natronolimnohabitans sp. A-GB9]|uniref:DUF7511 domain-containing protein n=1 Tax=Natronolimnohabitans sp. A-GB9 TaxID=3069757 RepID=UPI0027AE0FB9|nr:hypothetical protein [Natronolimnohabitans sp. A-GB9]MDQ2051908.1 hypothetical protein [Natronolimnohabitans sp. A-GB9]
MTTTDNPFDYDHDLKAPHHNQIDRDLVHTLVDVNDAPTELAIYPETTNDELLNRWIVATGAESFVDLADRR